MQYSFGSHPCLTRQSRGNVLVVGEFPIERVPETETALCQQEGCQVRPESRQKARTQLQRIFKPQRRDHI